MKENNEKDFLLDVVDNYLNTAKLLNSLKTDENFSMLDEEVKNKIDKAFEESEKTGEAILYKMVDRIETNSTSEGKEIREKLEKYIDSIKNEGIDEGFTEEQLKEEQFKIGIEAIASHFGAKVMYMEEVPRNFYSDGELEVIEYEMDGVKRKMGNIGKLNFTVKEDNIFFASEENPNMHCFMKKEDIMENHGFDFKELEDIAKHIGFYHWFKDNEILEEVKEKLGVTE